MSRRFSFPIALALAALVGAERLPAQSMPAITRAKAAAQHAANAASAHTEAMQAPSRAPDVPPPAKPAPATSAPAKPATKAVASAKATTAAKPDLTKPDAGKPAAADKAPSATTSGTSAPATTGARLAAAGAARAATAPATPAESPSTSTVSERGGKTQISLVRESFNYAADGRRDPFVSLLTSGELRPMISDLRLVTVVYDPAGRSVAILRDIGTKEQYRVKVGQTLGRMRVASIQPKSVAFTLEELGFSRQEVLALNDTTRARSQ